MLGGGNGKGRTWNGNSNCTGRGNEKVEQGVGMAEHGMTAYPLLP
jgi:hypothetical protein